MNKKVLVIVDIQKDYGEYFSYSYLKKVYSFLNKNRNKYEKIYMLYEPTFKTINNNPVDGISFITKDSIPICKLYNTEYSIKVTGLENEDKIIELYKSENTDSIVYSEGEVMINDVSYNSYDNNGNATKHIRYRIDFISNEMRKMIKEITNENYEVDLIGGGLSKCVKITQDILNKKNIKTNILKDYCYEIRHLVNRNRHDNIIFNKPPKGYFRKEFIDDEGFLKIIKLPNLIKQL